MQTFKADMQTLLNAVSPSAGGQNATASPSAGSAEWVNSALNTVVNDLWAMQGADRGDHHHHGGGSSVSGSQSQNPMQSLERSERAAKLPVIDVRYPKFGYRHGGEQSFERHFHVHERAVGG